MQISLRRVDSQEMRSLVVDSKEGALFLHYLDQALDIYGSSVKHVVYWKFEKSTHLSRNEIFAHPEQFVDTIRAIFGKGMSSIERGIVREIELNSGLKKLDSENLTNALQQLRHALTLREN